MMKRIKQKLNNQNGVSFLFAMLALLVATMVSITIVAAAVTSVKRVHSDRKAQQAHLTLESAAQLVRDEMKKTRYVIEETTETPVEGSPSTTITTSAEGTFANEIKTAVEHIDKHGTQYSSNDSTNFTIRVTGMDMKPVDVSFIMQADYKVIFTLTLEDTEETLFLTMGSSSSSENIPGVPDAEGNITTTTVKKVRIWEQSIISGVLGE